MAPTVEVLVDNDNSVVTVDSPLTVVVSLCTMVSLECMGSQMGYGGDSYSNQGYSGGYGSGGYGGGNQRTVTRWSLWTSTPLMDTYK